MRWYFVALTIIVAALHRTTVNHPLLPATAAFQVNVPTSARNSIPTCERAAGFHHLPLRIHTRRRAKLQDLKEVQPRNSRLNRITRRIQSLPPKIKVKRRFLRRHTTNNADDKTQGEVFQTRNDRLSTVTSRIRFLKSNNSLKRNKTKTGEPAVWVHDVHGLRREVLQNKIPLQKVGFNLTRPHVNATTVTTELLMNHSVVQLIAKRCRTNSTPGNRAPTDTAHLALSIEGGGMRGATSAGTLGS